MAPTMLAGPAVAAIVFGSARVAIRRLVYVPLASVGPAGVTTVSPMPLLPMATGWLGTGLPNTSRTRTVMVVALTPSATTPLGETETLEVVENGAPATNVARSCTLAGLPVNVTVFVSALFVRRVVLA